MNRDAIAHQIPGTRVLVDGFRGYHSPSVGPRGDALFFLSHFHGDHYEGLTAEWTTGVIHCSDITARLLVKVMGVAPQFVRALPFDQEVPIGRPEEQLSVTLLDANHCPGAALLLFACPDPAAAPASSGGGGGGAGEEEEEEEGRILYLHTGDMRYCEAMQSYPALAGRRVDTVYLDTTYAHPRHDFAAQEDAIRVIAETIEARLREEEEQGQQQQQQQPPPQRTVFLLSAYNLGKERLLIGVSKRVRRPVVVDERKMRVLDCLGLNAEDMACFTLDPAASPLHVCRMGFLGEMWPFYRPNWGAPTKFLEEQRAQGRGFTRVLGFIPTGWSEGSKYNKRNALQERGAAAIQLVPYSEHSNFPELLAFVKFLKPRRVVPTVFSDEKDRKKVAARFRHVVDAAANKRAFFQRFGSGSGATAAAQQQQRAQAAALGGGGGGGGEGQGDEEVICLDDDDSDGGGGGDDMGKSAAPAARAWSCAACTYLNPNGGGSGCAMCGTLQGGRSSNSSPSSAQRPWQQQDEGRNGGEEERAPPPTKKQKTLLAFLRGGGGAGGGGREKKG